MMIFGWFWLLLVPLAIAAVVLAARGNDRRDDSHRHAAQDTLARRYAEGQIDEQEYQERSATLTRMHPQHRSTSAWLLAIAVSAIALVITGLLWGGMGSGQMWNTMGRHMGWTTPDQITDTTPGRS